MWHQITTAAHEMHSCPYVLRVSKVEKLRSQNLRIFSFKSVEDGLLFGTISIQQGDLEEAHGIYVWGCSIIASAVLSSRNLRMWIKGKAFLDLSSGTGLSSIVAEKLGAKVTATERKPLLSLMNLNIQRNGSEILTRSYDWGSDISKVFPQHHFDLVLLSDLLYFSEQYENLVNTIEQLSRTPVVFLLIHQWRNREIEETFFGRLKSNFKVTFLFPSIPELLNDTFSDSLSILDAFHPDIQVTVITSRMRLNEDTNFPGLWNDTI